MDFDFMFQGTEVEFEGKTYLWVSRFTKGYITAVERDADLPAPVVVIPVSKESKDE